MTETAAPACYRHPERPTRLRCTECDRPICVDCSNDAAVGQKCPECSRATGRHRVVDARRTTGAAAGLTGAPATTVILVATIAVYVLSRGSGSSIAERLVLSAFAVDLGEAWRLVSHALLHSQTFLMHIVFNMYALYLFGPSMERQVGSVAFALFYAAAAAGGGAAFVALRPGGFAVGASGAIFGLFGAWLFAGWRSRHTPAGRAQFANLAVLLGINLALPFFVRNIAWEAHLGGLFVGVAIAAAWSMLLGRSTSPARDRSLTAAAALLVALVIGVLV